MKAQKQKRLDEVERLLSRIDRERREIDAFLDDAERMVSDGTAGPYPGPEAIARADTATAEKLLATMTPEQMDRGQRIVERWAGGSDASEHDATT